MQLHANDILGDRFQLERLLGEGGMGMVWAADDLKSKRRVALKFLRGNASASSMKRFFREARAAMAVAHPNVVRVHEVCTGPDGAPLMVMDYLEGESLGERLEKRGKLSLPDAASVLKQVVSAIGMAHEKGIVHRDLKPDNVFLCNAAGRFDVRVLDFGIAKLTANEGGAMATAGLTSTGAVLGTPYYMSPEQVFADKTVDHRADIWAIGILLYECLSGKKPLTGDSIGALLRAITDGRVVPLSELEPDLPDDVVSLASRMISTDREKRPRDLREVQAVLDKYAPELRTPAFGEATADGALAFDDTLPGAPLLIFSTHDGVASTQDGTPPRRQSRWALPVIGLVALSIGAGAVAIKGRLQAVPGAAPQAPAIPLEGASALSSAVTLASATPGTTTAATPRATPGASAGVKASATPTASTRTDTTSATSSASARRIQNQDPHKTHPSLSSSGASAPTPSAPKSDVIQTNPYGN